MPKIVTEDIGKFNQHYPRVAVVVTASACGKDGAMTAAWHSAVSFKPSLYGVAIKSERFTYQLIMESRQFAINFIPSEKASLAAAIGSISGQQTDKFQKLNMQKESPLRTTAPILRDAYTVYECKLVDNKPYGDHIWVVGEIVAVHLVMEAFSAAGVLAIDRVEPLLYLGSDFYASTDENSVTFIERGNLKQWG
jgi:flavin reductase (DIM6/NTAB) family NADH-FMN oxidoreductase RutF